MLPVLDCLTRSLETKPQREPGIELDGDVTPRTEFRCQPSTIEESRFRHSSWAIRRQKTWEALRRCHVSDAALDRFRECGSGLWLQLNKKAGELRMSCNTCRNRWCVPCGVARATKITGTLGHLMTGDTCRFVTLTRRHSHATLADQIDNLYVCFTRLRARQFWKENVPGGAGFLECKVSEKSGLWHVHLHLIVTTRWLDQKQLSREWLAVTGDSSIVDVRPIADPEGRARYVTKYVTKPADATVFNSPPHFDEMMVALKGRRLCFTFGTWRGVKLGESDFEPGDWEPVGGLDDLRYRARHNDPDALHWLQLAAVKWPNIAHVFGVSSG